MELMWDATDWLPSGDRNIGTHSTALLYVKGAVHEGAGSQRSGIRGWGASGLWTRKFL